MAKRRVGVVVKSRLRELMEIVISCDRTVRDLTKGRDEAKQEILLISTRYDLGEDTEASQFYRNELGTIQVTRPTRAPVLTPARWDAREKRWDPRLPTLLDVLYRKVEDADAARDLFLRVVAITGLSLDERAWTEAVQAGEVEDRWLGEALTLPDPPAPTVKVTPNRTAKEG